MIAQPGPIPVLLGSVASRTCAFPLGVVGETLRPLPLEPLSGAPGFVRGLSIIRGIPTPVVDLRDLLGGGPVAASSSRLVTLRVAERRVAVALDAVIGVATLDPARLEQLPPLLRDAGEGIIQSIGNLDGQLLVVLDGARLLPGDPCAVAVPLDAAP